VKVNNVWRDGVQRETKATETCSFFAGKRGKAFAPNTNSWRTSLLTQHLSFHLHLDFQLFSRIALQHTSPLGSLPVHFYLGRRIFFVLRSTLFIVWTTLYCRHCTTMSPSKGNSSTRPLLAAPHTYKTPPQERREPVCPNAPKRKRATSMKSTILAHTRTHRPPIHRPLDLSSIKKDLFADYELLKNVPKAQTSQAPPESKRIAEHDADLFQMPLVREPPHSPPSSKPKRRVIKRSEQSQSLHPSHRIMVFEDNVGAEPANAQNVPKPTRNAHGL